MSSRLREPFGKAGLIVAIVALVAATVGGAYAASHGKRHNKKGNAVAAQAKRYSKAYSKRFSKAFSKRFAVAGPAGPQGPAGATGPKGDKGDAGANGTNGTNGTDGTNGTNGTNGTSAEAVAYSGSECAGASGEEGIEVTSAAATQYVCNGADGNPAEYPETLPSGRSETGAWALPGYVLSAGFEEFNAPISFPIKLGFEPTVKFVTPAQSGTSGSVSGCPGKVTEPEAEAGNLCVYSTGGGYEFIGAIQSPPFGEVEGKSGTVLNFGFEGSETEALGYGTWAVTAP